VQRGEKGYASPLSAKTWGFQDVMLKGQPLKIARPFGSYVMENILLKIAFPAEFHAQTAVECAIHLHKQLKNRIQDIEKIVIQTQESAVRIINKTGPLYNYADRDHSLQYMVSAALLHGNLKPEYYNDEFANDPRIDQLREKMEVVENKSYSKDYLDPEKRSIANSIQIYFTDGTKTQATEVEYPIGHKRRRAEGIPLLIEKFENAMSKHYSADELAARKNLFLDQDALNAMPVDEFMNLFVKH